MEIPLNPRGALEMGLCPCEECSVGWCSFTKDEVKSCRDECIYWQDYMERYNDETR